MYLETTALKKILRLKKRIRGVQGGTSASKTIGIIQDLVDLALRDETPTLTSIVSESFPHLRRGAMRDWENIMTEHRYFKDKRWDKTNSIYTYETGSKIEFFSVDQSAKVRGARRDRLFINEANNISYSAFEELEVRTKDFIFLDWNPVSEFWWNTEIVGKRTDYEHLILNYLDNEGISPEIKASIEQRRNRKGWWKVYGLGELGEVEGKIYSDWKIIDEIPHEARLERYGLNFGFTGHPAAIIALYYLNGGYIIDQIAYGQGMKNRIIADTILSQQRKALTVADSAEPKSIDELMELGINIVPAEKGKDSVRYGIGVVQDLPISITSRSVDIIREYRNYLWRCDINGKIIEPNEPEEPFHYSMDAVRYAIVSLAPVKRREELIRNMPRYAQDKPRPNPAR